MQKLLIVSSFALALVACTGASAAAGEAAPAAPVTCTSRTVVVSPVPPAVYQALTPAVATMGGALVAGLPTVVGTTITALRARVADSPATTLTLAMATQTDNIPVIIISATGTPSAGNGSEQTITELVPTNVVAGVQYVAFVNRATGVGQATVSRIEFDEQTCR